MKTVKILFISAFLFVFSFVHAQPKRIPNSDVYWELGNDSTILFTGKGAIPRNTEIRKIRNNIKEIKVSEGITGIKNGAFCYFYTLEKVVLPQSLRSIEGYAFNDDSNIRSINIPDKLEILEYGAFGRVRGVPDSLFLHNLIFFGAHKEGSTTVSGYQFFYTPVKYVEMPFKIDTMYDNFHHCYQLATVVIPANVKHFTGGTFANDTALHLVVNLSPIPQTFEVPSKLQTLAFYGVDQSKCRLLVPTSAVNLYKSTPIWQDFIIEGGGLYAGIYLNSKEKGYIEGYEYRLYKAGETITWKAEPKAGCTFSGWRSGNQWLSSSSVLSFTITKDTMIEAVFEGEPLSVPVKNDDAEKIRLYPNPAHTYFTVQCNAAVIGITVYDLSGRKVLQTNDNTVNVSQMDKGAYLVEVYTESGRYMKKFIRQ